MKRTYNIFTLLVIALFGLSLTACDSGDDLSTDQYGNEISLNAFGPCPVLRGGTLYFYGSNLDQITEIDLPGADPITSIEVIQKGVPSKISITVPAEKCDTGKVVLHTAKGGTITTVTPVTYREDIVLDEFYVGQTGNLTGSVGDVVTIKGDYLNLMHGVIFAENDTVKEESFLSHDRYTITVAIPDAAKTGTIKITDLADEPTELESKEALVVNLPEVTGLSDETIKAGNALTIYGSSLDQIVSVKFNGATVDAADFLTDDPTNIAVEVPATATDGEVTLVTKSGVEIPAGSITTVVPTELSASPAPVKNGAVLTISGKDLDLITSATFPNVSDAVSPSAKKETSLTLTVPETAQEGDITLALANGKTVTVAYTLVAPTVTACSPNALTAGERLLIRGTDLDLVASVVFPGDVEQTVSEFSAQSANAIGLTVPAAAAGNDFKLVLKNGTEVAPTGVLTIKAATDPAISAIAPAEQTAGGTITITGKNFQNMQNLYIGSYKVTRYTSRTATEIVCQVPSDATVGTYTIKMETFDGVMLDGPEFKVVAAEKDLADYTENMDGSKITYPYKFTWDDSGRFRIMKSDLIAMGAKEGSQLKFYKEASATGQVQINDANWGNSEYVSDWSGTESVVIYTFGANAMTAINSTSDGWSDTAFILQGDLSGVTSIVFVP